MGTNSHYWWLAESNSCLNVVGLYALVVEGQWVTRWNFFPGHFLTDIFPLVKLNVETDFGEWGRAYNMHRFSTDLCYGRTRLYGSPFSNMVADESMAATFISLFVFFVFFFRFRDSVEPRQNVSELW